MNQKLKLVCAFLTLPISACGSYDQGSSGADPEQTPAAEVAMGPRFEPAGTYGPEPEDPFGLQGPELGTAEDALHTVYMFGFAIPPGIILQQPFDLEHTPILGRCGSAKANLAAPGNAPNSCVFPEGRFTKSTWTWSFQSAQCGTSFPPASIHTGPGIGNGPGQCSQFDFIFGNCNGKGPFARDFIGIGAFDAFKALNASGMGVTFRQVQDDDLSADIIVDCDVSSFTNSPENDAHIAYGTPAGFGSIIPQEVAFGDGAVTCASTGKAFSQKDLGSVMKYHNGSVHFNMSTFYANGAGWASCVPAGLNLTQIQAQWEGYAKATALHELGHVFGFSHVGQSGNIMNSALSCAMGNSPPPWGAEMTGAIQLNDTRSGAIAPYSTGIECTSPEI